MICKNNLIDLKGKGLFFCEFTSGEAYSCKLEPWDLSQRQRVPEERGKPRKCVLRWPVAGPLGWPLTSSQFAHSVECTLQFEE
jgi:hypothetical protein